MLWENGKDSKWTRHIARRLHFVRNGKKCKIHKIYWCEGGLQLVDIATNNVGENDLNTRINISWYGLKTDREH